MKTLIDLLNEIIEAGERATLPLGMAKWHCGTSCCLCGDVAVMRNPGVADVDCLAVASHLFSDDLDDAFLSVFGAWGATIYMPRPTERQVAAVGLDVFTPEELNHPHLTTDHSDRAVAHDFIRLIIRKAEERKS